jgi:calcineurin-like phosphoesterase family protein
MRPCPTSPARVAMLVVLLATLQSARPATSYGASPPSPASITAVGDVHGAFDELVGVLQHDGLIDAQHHWVGGNTTLVQTGDMIDRGPKPREVLDLLMSLQKEAPKRGGRVVVLLGNHEVMNMMGDLRYVTAENYASYASKNSEKLQHSSYRQYLDWRKDHHALLASVPQAFPEASEAEWMASHPAGFIEQRQAFSPDGKYGKWLRERPAVAELDHIIFVHGGIDPGLGSMSLEDMDRHVHQELGAFDRTKDFLVAQRLILPFFTLQEITAVVQAEVAARQNAPGSRHPSPANPEGQLPEHTQMELLNDFLQYGQWLSVASNGPLWFRGYDQWSDEQVAANLPAVLAAYRATGIVVGHTPQRDGRIRSRLDGKLFLIDTGMLSRYYPQGKASTLEIRDGTNFTAEYMDQKVALSGEAKR